MQAEGSMALKGLGDSLKGTFQRIARMGSVDRQAVESVLRDLQRSLIQADVDVAMVSELSGRIRKRVLEEKLPPGMTMREHLIKSLYDEIVAFLGKDRGTTRIGKQRVLLMGLFGSGKTTSAGKLAKWFMAKGLTVGLVACDTHRAAAQEQLRQVGLRAGCSVYSEGRSPRDIAERAARAAREDVLIFDSAGRSALDRELARELKELAGAIRPDEALLVIPADIGQAARRQADEFNNLVGITGVIVTKLDGTARGGGALAATAVSGAKVKFIGTGEKSGDFEAYDPQRFVSRLIGYGDLQGLLERASEAGVDRDSAQRMLEGKFTLMDFMEQIKAVQKMGSLSKIAEMIPGVSGMKLPQELMDVQEGKMGKWNHIMGSMTKAEREDPDLIKHSRLQRIAKGAGVTESDVRDLLKYYKQVQKLMRMAKGGKAFKRGPFARMARQMGMKFDMSGAG
jgi:signal recognition particle subunit SRP54